MKKIVIATLLAFAVAPAVAQTDAPALPDPSATLDNLVRDVTGSGADEAAAATPAAPAAAEAQKKTGWRQWHRNRQIERGPRALRPGHHRRLLRTSK